MRALRLRKKSMIRFVASPICLCDRRTLLYARALPRRRALSAGKQLALRASAHRWLQGSGQTHHQAESRFKLPPSDTQSASAGD